MSKKILKGLKNLSIFPITKNDATEYTAGQAILVPSLQSLTMDPQMSEWKVFADDTVYESGSDWGGMNLSFQVAELPLELKKYFEGGEYDEQEKEYTYKDSAVAPEIGASFAAQTSDGQYRMVKLYSLRATRVRGDYRTKGEGGDSSTPITIDATVMSRNKDSVVKREKDSTGGDLSWLDDLNDAPTP